MKKLYYLVIALFFLSDMQLFAQNGMEKYSRIKILLDGKSMTEIASLEVAVDHGEYVKGQSFTTELSATELDILKKNGIRYEVLIDDVTLHFIKESQKSPVPEKHTRVTNCTPNFTYTTPANFNYGSMGSYYTYQQILNHLDSLASKFPSIVKAKAQIDTFTSIEGRPIYWMKISDNPNVDENEPEILMDALHHAREPMSITQMIFFMYYLCENYNTNAEVKYFVDHSEIYFIPIVNPDGYVYNQTTNPGGGGMWRKNRRPNAGGTYGVDLNRNYGYFWGYNNVGSSPTPSSDTYRGTAGFSEPETRAVKYLCEHHQFRISLNNHTYGNLLVYPWGYTDSNTPDSMHYHQIAKSMSNYNRFVYGTGTETVGYTTNGDADDWMHGETGTKNKIFSFTPEAGDGGTGFWPSQANILPYCNLSMHTNMNLMRSALAYADCDDIGSRFLTPTSSSAKYMLFNRGMTTNATFTVSIIPITNNITVGAPKMYNSPAFMTTLTDSISISVNPMTLHGDQIRYLLRVNNGFVNYDDTVTKYYAVVTQTEFSSNCNSMSGWTGTGSWGNNTQFFTSPTGSISESPAGNYSNNVNSTIITTLPINLTAAIRAELKFRIKWSSECNLDYLQVKVSNNNGASYSSICTRYAMKSKVNSILNQPAYDGAQAVWQYDEANLDAFLGQNILLRFDFISDGGLVKDGFYIDDVKIETMQNYNFPLPLSISPINLVDENCNVKVYWSSYSEKDVDYFNIERSEDGMVFQQIGRVEALGNSSTKTDYSFLDQSANAKSYQYRIQVVSKDNQTAYSETKTMKLPCDIKDVLIYPNPAGNETNVMIKSNHQENYQLKVIDIYGKTVYENAFNINKETKIIRIPTANWATGNYTMIVNNGKESKVLRFVKGE
ncbi:MAG: immune inhibitor A [Bacteroidetes bacterium]|nr:immune inhibitor A [Bacteroidota bacterium]